MKHLNINKTTLAGAIVLAISQPALAVSDEDFKVLQEQFNQLADQVNQNSQSTSLSNTTIGGYGELHYNNLHSSKNPDEKTIDLHRFVLTVNHEFNDHIRFFSEVEIEHNTVKDNNNGSGETSKGEVEVEQAYIQFDLNDNTRANAGVFLMPVGI
ncbi:MAG: porin, partial [Gammaproteobacteria bacterium]|nr:porin [Gammaproteobacteria bacterium]